MTNQTGDQSPASQQRFLVCSGMRNEGAFLVEWLCWYRMLGFEVLVVTNDCTDHSVELLELFEAADWLAHAGHIPGVGQPPKRSAYDAMRAHSLMAEVDWVLVCDVDEFLVFKEAEDVAAYVSEFSPPPLGFAFHWRSFGTSGVSTWQDGLVHRMFLHAAETENRANSFYKSLYRRPLDFAKISDHSPIEYSGPWEVSNHVWVDCNGVRLKRMVPDERPQKATSARRVRHDKAQMNHYVIRADESFDLKRGVLSASSGRDRYNDEFYEKFNHNDFYDDSAARFADRFDAVYAQAMEIPGVRRLHHLCCADYVARLAEHHGQTAADDARWQHHMAAADSDPVS